MSEGSHERSDCQAKEPRRGAGDRRSDRRVPSTVSQSLGKTYEAPAHCTCPRFSSVDCKRIVRDWRCVFCWGSREWRGSVRWKGARLSFGRTFNPASGSDSHDQWQRQLRAQYLLRLRDGHHQRDVPWQFRQLLGERHRHLRRLHGAVRFARRRLLKFLVAWCRGAALVGG